MLAIGSYVASQLNLGSYQTRSANKIQLIQQMYACMYTGILLHVISYLCIVTLQIS